MGAVPLPIRIRTTVLIVLLSLLAGGAWAGIGEAQTATSGPAGSLAPVTTPRARVGDEGVYEILTGDQAGDPLHTRFRVLPDSELYGSFPGHHLTNELEVWWPSQAIWERRAADRNAPELAHVVYSLDQSSRETIAVRSQWNHSSDSERILVDVAQEYAYQDIHLQDHDAAPHIPCALAVDPKMSGLLTLRPCALLHHRIEAPLPLNHVDTLRAAGPSYSLYRGSSADGTYDVLLRSDLPYPLQISVASEVGNALESWTFTAFTRGDQPIGQKKSSQSPLPDVEWVPWPRDGPDISGLPLALPLETAVEVARSHRDSRLPAFLEEHPNAFLYHGSYETSAYDHETIYRWTLVYGVGTDVHQECVEERRLVPLPPGPDRAAARQEIIDCGLSSGARAPPEPPRLAPSVRSVADWYETYRGGIPELQPANAVTFSARCLDKDCVARRTSIAVGHRFQFDNSDDVGLPHHARPAPSTYYHSGLVVDGTGAPEQIAYRSSEEHARELPSGGPVSAPPASLSSVEPVPILRDAPAFTPAETATVGLIALLLGLLTWFLPTLKNLFLGPLFTRIQRPKILDHGMRARIRQAVEEDPGIHGRELARRLGLARGSLIHHVRMMEQAGALRVVRTRGYATYFPPHEDASSLPEGLAHLRSETAREILQRIAGTPGASASELARGLGLSPQGVLHHIARLVDGGLVQRDDRRRPAPLHLTDEGRTALERLGAGPGPTAGPDPS